MFYVSIFSQIFRLTIEKKANAAPLYCHQDGDFELQRKVPYDYDSEFQDMFMRIASALYNGHMTLGLPKKCPFKEKRTKQQWFRAKTRIESHVLSLKKLELPNRWMNRLMIVMSM